MTAKFETLEEQSLYYDEDNETWEFDRWKFASLIVRACADTVLGFHNQFGDSAHNEIRKHFGVE